MIKMTLERAIPIVEEMVLMCPVNSKQMEKELAAIDTILIAYNQEKEKNKVLANLIFKLRSITKNKVLVRENENLSPRKNLTKQEVYESFLQINHLLKGNYVFLEDEKFLEELLKKEIE